MNLYADSSFFVASRVKRDTFYAEAVEFYRGREHESWLWSPWHRIEVFNTIRQLTRNPDTKRRLSEGEAKELIHRLERDVQLGYLQHVDADWRDVFQSAHRISMENAFARSCSAADLLHVAYAREAEAGLFVSFDDDQVALAEAAGLEALNPAR